VIRARSVVAGCALAAAIAGCTTKSAPPPTDARLEGELARVGDEAVSVQLVQAIAASRACSARQALDYAVEDSLAAQAAAKEGLAGEGAPAGWAVDSALGQVVTLRLQEQAREKGLPDDDELSHLKVVHVVVLRSPSVSPAHARFVASSLATAVASARTAEEFEARAKATKSDLRTSVEELPAFDAAGRMETGLLLDPDFVVAAFALRSPGDTSPVTETSFGWHVIRLVSREGPGADRAARSAELAEAVYSLRARGALTDLLGRRRAGTPVETAAGADRLMASVVPVR
jgi:hypothetical protein